MVATRTPLGLPCLLLRARRHDRVGAVMEAPGSWRTAPANAFIVGLKELPENDSSPLTHRHVYFGHCFKGQHGWKDLLARFVAGNGALLDMEFLND